MKTLVVAIALVAAVTLPQAFAQVGWNSGSLHVQGAVSRLQLCDFDFLDRTCSTNELVAQLLIGFAMVVRDYRCLLPNCPPLITLR
jgi:hypothetical protein